LQYVSAHRMGRRVAEETLSMWPPESLRRDMSDAEQDALVAAFQQRAEQLMQRPPREKGKRKRRLVETSSPSVTTMPAPPSPSVSSSTTTADGSSFSSSLTAARLPAANAAATATAATVTAAAALPWLLSGCVEQLAEQPDALTVTDLPLDFSVPLRASTRLALAATDNSTASPDAMALPVEEDSNAAPCCRPPNDTRQRPTSGTRRPSVLANLGQWWWTRQRRWRRMEKKQKNTGRSRRNSNSSSPASVEPVHFSGRHARRSAKQPGVAHLASHSRGYFLRLSQLVCMLGVSLLCAVGA